jgi:hypothetical protein
MRYKSAREHTEQVLAWADGFKVRLHRVLIRGVAERE